MAKHYSKAGCFYSISTDSASVESLEENGFFEMQSEYPGRPHVARADGSWAIDSAMAFDLLRTERNRRIAATDYLMTPDYPITEDGRTAVEAYRQALRDLPAQDGAPWDGGDGVPWPKLNALCKVTAEQQAPAESEERLLQVEGLSDGHPAGN